MLENFEVGLIGMGDMGALYARCFAEKQLRVNCCDLPSQYVRLSQVYKDNNYVNVYKDGFAVTRRSDLVLFCVETANVESVVAKFGPSIKLGATVGGQTSVKSIEIDAFEKYIPDDTNIVSCHSLHGPKVTPAGQTLVVIRHRCEDDKMYEKIKTVYELLDSKIVELSAAEHDKVTADTQVSTHLGFLAMGTAWKNIGVYPWEDMNYIGGIENVKVLMALRIFSMKSHVYSGLALSNPHARAQVKQYSDSVTELWRLMIQEAKEEFTKRIKNAGEAIFGSLVTRPETTFLLPDKALDEFGLGVVPQEKMVPNSHLSLLAMVDCWHQAGINPYNNLVCQTPVFRLRLGLAEYLFKTPFILDQTINCCLYDKNFRGDDIEFFAAVREWVTIIRTADSNAFERQFNDTQNFFKDRLFDGKDLSSKLIEKLAKLNRKQEK